MKEFIIKNFVPLIIAVLVIVLLLQRCGSNGDMPKTTHDTLTTLYYHYITDSGKSKPVFIQGKRDTILESSVEYIPSQDYDELKEQFEDLRAVLLSQNIYKDQIKIDTLGTVDITDTIQKNQIIGRSFVNNLKIPEKTTIITNIIYPKQKNKYFIGGGISGNQLKPINDFNLGLGLLNKKNQLFEIKGRVDLRGNLYGEFNTYWKIKPKK